MILWHLGLGTSLDKFRSFITGNEQSWYTSKKVATLKTTLLYYVGEREKSYEIWL